jgi:hypothetical protein
MFQKTQNFSHYMRDFSIYIDMMEMNIYNDNENTNNPKKYFHEPKEVKSIDIFLTQEQFK